MFIYFIFIMLLHLLLYDCNFHNYLGIYLLSEKYRMTNNRAHISLLS